MSNTIPNLKEKVQRVVAQPQRAVDKIARGEVAATFAQKVAGIRERLKLGETSPELVAVDWP